MDEGVDAWLVQKLVNKGVSALSAEEVGVCHSSVAFKDEWFRSTGTDLPEKIWTQICDRVNRAHQRFAHGGVSDVQLFHKYVIQGDAEQVRQMLRRSPDARALLQGVDQ